MPEDDHKDNPRIAVSPCEDAFEEDQSNTDPKARGFHKRLNFQKERASRRQGTRADSRHMPRLLKGGNPVSYRRASYGGACRPGWGWERRRRRVDFVQLREECKAFRDVRGKQRQQKGTSGSQWIDEADCVEEGGQRKADNGRIKFYCESENSWAETATVPSIWHPTHRRRQKGALSEGRMIQIPCSGSRRYFLGNLSCLDSSSFQGLVCNFSRHRVHLTDCDLFEADLMEWDCSFSSFVEIVVKCMNAILCTDSDVLFVCVAGANRSVAVAAACLSVLEEGDTARDPLEVLQRIERAKADKYGSSWNCLTSLHLRRMLVAWRHDQHRLVKVDRHAEGKGAWNFSESMSPGGDHSSTVGEGMREFEHWEMRECHNLEVRDSKRHWHREKERSEHTGGEKKELGQRGKDSSVTVSPLFPAKGLVAAAVVPEDNAAGDLIVPSDMLLQLEPLGDGPGSPGPASAGLDWVSVGSWGELAEAGETVTATAGVTVNDVTHPPPRVHCGPEGEGAERKAEEASESCEGVSMSDSPFVVPLASDSEGSSRSDSLRAQNGAGDSKKSGQDGSLRRFVVLSSASGAAEL
uniref:Uncharacterized protein n=1 Tax=Chromera velia CCMP2878 TaxID=1169474 RepID=A0A0G4H876_9ALVE|eukprot:Cvel_5874.t1-p1 / transcript=Cvel_5874.t1 / gene=Cvel_5874 / organism=Chromera_velia_CCMP2878 / gene_product=hypothetical protein / transcript_product=hypothetical protein / location=Cvel_scaffold279:94873-96609(-) / protein_length=579 / sequence_SO=supercontig / SO=protein_coding / is_pseudo=false